MVFLEGVVDTTLDEMDSSYIHTHKKKKHSVHIYVHVSYRIFRWGWETLHVPSHTHF